MRILTRVGCAAALAALLTGTAVALPAHYVVFTIGADGKIRADFYTQVVLAGSADDNQRYGEDATDTDHAEKRVAYHAFRDGADLGEHTVVVPELRAEFARDPEHGDGRIESFPAVQQETSFVLRIPLGEADAVEFATAKRGKQRFDLAQLAAAHMAAPPSLDGMHVDLAAASGDPANRVDMLVLGDGYTSAQQSQFNSDAQALHNAFFGMTPYMEYSSFVNWTTGFVASAQSGADHPPYQAGCTTSACCADAEAQTDPLAGQFVNTAFDATFCTAQIHRLVTVNGSKVFTAAAAYPNWDKIVVVVNDAVYGGSGGSYSVTTTNASANQIVLHEYGHSFSHLADEYSSPYPGYPPCSDTSGSAPCEPNVTDQTVAAQVKWASWFNPANPIPTPVGSGYTGVGLFQGARYLSSGMYRPVDTQCIMQFLGMPFCPVCAQTYVLRLYAGGWGSPANGIDLIEPGSESPPSATPVNYSLGSTQVFQATLLQPTIGTLGAQWYLDGNAIGGANTASYSYSTNSATPSTHTLELRVTDETPLVKPAMAGNLLVHSRTWTIQVGSDEIFKNGFQ